MFRDSHGVVHTVCSTDPLLDLPGDTARLLAAALLRPDRSDLPAELERCELVRELVESWQDAFFAALPDDVDLAEEARWAAEAGLSLADVESSYESDELAGDLDGELGDELDGGLPDELADPLDDDPLHDDPLHNDPLRDDPLSDDPLHDELTLDPHEHDPRQVLPEELVSDLERGLLLLPLRVRLEALVAAGALVGTWSDLLADHEKALGHLVLAHHEPLPAHAGQGSQGLSHESLWDRHARLHAATGPDHAGD